MSNSVASHQTGSYRVSTLVYEGPLDLLLQLIEHAELDITRLALAQVTDQYLAYLRNMSELPAEEVSAFLVIASKLLQIKSEALLPHPPAPEPGEEDLGDSLARQLLEYKRYKEIAVLLAERQTANLRTYLRLASPPSIESRLDLSSVKLADLLSAARTAIASTAQAQMPSLSSVVSLPTVTIREKIKLISTYIRSRGRIAFYYLIRGTQSRLDVIVTFLAMLELIKLHLVNAHQENLFGDIELEAMDNWDENEELNLEFGE